MPSVNAAALVAIDLVGGVSHAPEPFDVLASSRALTRSKKASRCFLEISVEVTAAHRDPLLVDAGTDRVSDLTTAAGPDAEGPDRKRHGPPEAHRNRVLPFVLRAVHPPRRSRYGDRFGRFHDALP